MFAKQRAEWHTQAGPEPEKVCCKSRMFILRQIGGPGLARVIVRRVSGTVALRIFSMGTIFVTRVLLARVMGVAEFGVFSYALTWLDLLVVLAVFGSERMILRELAMYQAQENWSRAKALVRFSVIAGVGFSVVVGVLAELILWITSRETNRHLMSGFSGVPVWFTSVDTAYLAVAVIVTAVPWLVNVRVCSAVMQALQHTIRGQIAEFGLRPVLFLAVLLLWIGWFEGTEVAAWQALLLYNLTLMAAALFSIVLMLRGLPVTYKDHVPHYQPGRWIAAMIPLMLLNGAYFVNARMGIILLGLFANSTAVGLFSVAERIVTLMTLVMGATNYALAPYFARYFTRQDWPQMQMVTTWGARGVFLVAGMTGIFFIIFAQPVLELFGPEFVAASPVLIILILGQFVNAFCNNLADDSL